MTKPQAKSTPVEPMVTLSKAPAKPKTMTLDSSLAIVNAAKKSRSKSAKNPAALPYTADATKHQRILALLQRDTGASIAELQSATNWQAHSVRGFLSATVRKKLQLPLVAELRATGERVYRITGGNDA